MEQRKYCQAVEQLSRHYRVRLRPEKQRLEVYYKTKLVLVVFENQRFAGPQVNVPFTVLVSDRQFKQLSYSTRLYYLTTAYILTPLNQRHAFLNDRRRYQVVVGVDPHRHFQVLLTHDHGVITPRIILGHEPLHYDTIFTAGEIQQLIATENYALDWDRAVITIQPDEPLQYTTDELVP